jgi:ABC-type lipoprotein release transport system permease subunit
MHLLQLILKELRHRSFNALLAGAAVTLAVFLYVGFYSMGRASDRETTRLMRDLGFNLRIIPAATDEAIFWKQGYATETMPEDYVNMFMNQQGISYRHLLATLQRTLPVGGVDLLLTGLAPEVSPFETKKKPMVFEIERGTLYLGFHAARHLKVSEGDPLELNGKTYTVTKILSEKGSEDDIRIQGHLKDVQQILNMDGRINEIQALECLCRDPNVDSLDTLKAELKKILPDAKVIMLRDMAKTRERQRITNEKYFAISMQIVLLVCSVWLAVLAFLNVRERKTEIGVLRALGYGTGSILALVMGKGLAIGLLGALLGFGAASAVVLTYGPDIFQVTAGSIAIEWSLLKQALLAAPLLTACCSMIPAVYAATQDPAETLREQ